ncbi:MAG: DNA replication and repair protein RecF [Mariprofundaceae bacterium]
MTDEGFGATPILLRRMRVRSLRCHALAEWTCDEGINLLIGENGSGKTTMLEAAALMVRGRSFRQARDPRLVREGDDRLAVHGEWRRFGPVRLAIEGARGRLRQFLQGREVRQRRDIAESFPLLIEAPQGVRIVDGVPGDRKRWLDSLVAVRDPAMRGEMQAYLRAVMQRARLLRRPRRPDGAELEAWEHRLVRHGLDVVAARRALIDEMNQLLDEERGLTESPLRLDIRDDYQADAWIARLAGGREADARRGLRHGPHCDAPAILFRGREIRAAGSRGQQKLAAIAIKMAECALWQRHRSMIPVLLLDDCFDALDEVRRDRLLERLAASPAQALMSAPHAPRLPRGIGMRIDKADELARSGQADAGMEKAA